MKVKKITALVLAAAMATGSSMTAFAAGEANDATGTGTLLPHLDKDIITVTLPTSAQVTNVFDFTVDPEQLIKDAGKLTDSTVVTGNDAGVYFKNAGSAAVNGTAAYTSTTNTGNYTITVSDLTKNVTYTYDGSTDNQWEDSEGNAAGVTITITDDDNSNATVTPSDGDTVTVSGGAAAGAASYSERSDEVEFKGRNSVDVDITVTAEVEESSGSANDIELVADQDALDAATDPALLMTLKVGTDEKAITTESGATAIAKIAGVPNNFKVDVDNNVYKYVEKDDVAESTWGSAKIQLIGKTNKVSVPTGSDALTAPKVKLTWNVAKSTAPAAPAGPQVNMSTSGLITVSGLTSEKNYAGRLTVTDGTLTKTQADAGLVWNTEGWDRTDGGTFTVQLPNGWITYWAGKEVTITIGLSDSTTITKTVELP